MFGGSNTNSLVPVYLDENLFQHPSNQLQLFGNVPAVDPVNYSGREQNSPVFQSNKRPREVEANLMQKKLQISLNQNYYNEESDHPSSIPNPHAVSTGLKLSYDDEERNSSITSASGSMTAAPSIMSSFGDSVTTELDRQNEELERYVLLQGDNMLKGVKDIRQRHMASILASIGKGIDQKLREKDLEIETINRKNKELVERIKQVANEAQNWHYRAKYNESVVNMLKTNLQQALAQGNDQQVKEGFGDTDLENDAVSSIDPNNYLGLRNHGKASVLASCLLERCAFAVWLACLVCSSGGGHCRSLSDAGVMGCSSDCLGQSLSASALSDGKDVVFLVCRHLVLVTASLGSALSLRSAGSGPCRSVLGVGVLGSLEYASGESAYVVVVKAAGSGFLLVVSARESE
ncbi:BOI-related E3 ubiquitin-protein ligase 1-like protein [Tanacetum coccineum]